MEQPDIIKSGRESDFDPDKRVEIPPVREADKEKVFDPDKRVEAADDKEADAERIEKPDAVLEQIGQKIGTKDGLEKLMEKHPEKKELWDSISEALDTLNNPDASAVERRSAQGTLSSAKGQILEIAAKDALADAGLDVENTQRTVEGERGKTRPDIITHNHTDKPIEVLGIEVQPGESLSVECKCGTKDYLEGQLRNHIPNQLSGHEGRSVLLTTSDIKDTQPGLAEGVCDKYNTKLAGADIGVKQVETTMKEVFGK